MLKKIVIKNPGCQFCKYYLSQFEYNGKLTTAACTKHAKKVFQHVSKSQKRKWKWGNCTYAEEVNKSRLCRDFQIQSLLFKFRQRLSLVIRGAKDQQPPTFSGEIWWDT